MPFGKKTKAFDLYKKENLTGLGKKMKKKKSMKGKMKADDIFAIGSRAK